MLETCSHSPKDPNVPYESRNLLHGGRNVRYGGHNMPYGNRNMPYGGRNLPYESRNLSYGGHNLSYGNRNLSSGSVICRLEVVMSIMMHTLIPNPSIPTPSTLLPCPPGDKAIPLVGQLIWVVIFGSAWGRLGVILRSSWGSSDN